MGYQVHYHHPHSARRPRCDVAPKGFWHNQHVSLALRAVPLTRTFSAANAATPGKAVPTRRGRASLLGTLLGGAGPHAGSVPPCLNHVPARNPDCRHKLTLPQCTPQYPTNLGLQASSQSGAQRWVWPCEVSGTPSLTPDLGCVLSSGLPRLCPPVPGTKGSQTSGQHQEGSRGHGVHGARVMWSPELGTCMRTSNPVPCPPCPQVLRQISPTPLLSRASRSRPGAQGQRWLLLLLQLAGPTAPHLLTGS